MKRFTLVALTACAVSSAVMAESWTGDIAFNGSITNSTCKFESSSTVDSHNIYVNMGNVSADVVDTISNPIFSPAVIASNGTSAVVRCSDSAKGLSMVLKAPDTSLHRPSDPTILKVMGGAKGVGIALYSSTAGGMPWSLTQKNGFFDKGVVFSKTAAELAAANAAGGIPVRFAAAYVLTSWPVVPGAANAVLPFEMKYE